VLARRDVNWDQYYEYFGKERVELIVGCLCHQVLVM